MATSTGPIVNPVTGMIGSLPGDRVQELLKLQKAAQKISSILDLDQLIDKIVNDIACSFGCAEINVFLHEPEQSEMVLAGVHGCSVHHKGHRLKVGKEGLVGYVAATGQMRYAPDVSLDPYYIACEKDTRSEVAIPLHVDGELVGVFTASHREPDAFDADQLWLFQGLCIHIAVAVQNARRFQQERSEREKMSREAQEARSIQQALLPKSSPFIPGFAVSGLSISAGAIGGDWYDFIDLGEGRWGLVLADVSGKGTAAALLMSATRAVLRSLAENSCTPAEVLTKLNGVLVADFPSGRFVTMVYAVLDPGQGTLTYASAGHLPPLLVEPSGARFLETEMGLPLGIRHGSYSEATVQLPDQFRIALYSDGITEATNLEDEEYGPGRLARYVQRMDACPDTLLEDVRAFANGAGLRDDATIIMLCRK
ncbi:MAG: GAF domain-containing SpoIIE family protein phosphatase [Terriglobales bacterium]